MKTIMIKTKNILKIGVFSIVILSLLISPILKTNILEVHANGNIEQTQPELWIEIQKSLNESSAVSICNEAFGDDWTLAGMFTTSWWQHKFCLFQIGIIEGLGKMFEAVINLGIVMIQWAFEPATYGGFVTNPAVADVGKIIRDFVNLILVLALVFIAIATILGIKKYSWQNTLWKLVVVALLVNFSLVISGMILDVSHFLAYNFLTLAKGNGDETLSERMISAFHATSTMDDLTKYSYSGVKSAQVTANDVGASATSAVELEYKGGWGLSWGNFFLVVICMILIGLFAVIALLGVFVAMLIRSLFIVALLVLSPIAFAAWIFPDTEKYWKMWWQQFIKWCTFPIIFALMLFIGITMVSKIFTTVGSGAGADFGIMAFIIQMFLFSMFLVGGLIFSIQGGGATAQFVTKQAGKLGLAAGSAVGGFTLGRIVNSGWYNKIAEKLSAKEGRLGEKPFLGAITRPISSQLYSIKARFSATQAKKEEEELKAISGEENALTNYVISARRLGKTTSALKALKIKADNAFEFTDAERQFMVQLPERFGGTEEARRIYKYNAAVRIDKSTGKPIAPLHVATRYNLSPASEMNVEEVIKTLGANAQDFLANTQYGILQTASTIRQIAKFIQDIPASHLERFLIYLSKNVFGTPQKPISLHEWLSNNNKPIATLIENPPKGGRESDLASLITTVWNTK